MRFWSIIILIVMVVLVTASFSPLPPPAEEVEEESKPIEEEIEPIFEEQDEPLHEELEVELNEVEILFEEVVTNIIEILQPKISKQKAEEIAVLTVELSEKYDLDSLWMLAMMYTESRFDNSVVSSEGARGLMQLIPSTAKIYGVTKEQLHVPVIDIDTGFQYYRYLLDLFEDEELATIAYNQGPGNVRRGTYRTWYYKRVKEAYNEILKTKEEL
jgi:soluble lytic murein transglycosylase-like protein